MPIDSERVMQIREDYERTRLEIRRLLHAEDWPGAIDRATRAFQHLEEQQRGLAYLFEAAIDLSVAFGSSGDWESSEALLEQCSQVRQLVCGPMAAETATAVMMLGIAKLQLSKYPDAEELIRQSLRIREQIFGDSHPQVALTLTNLAAVYDKTGRGDAAAQLRERAMRIDPSLGDP